jgi:hypothetical protein
LHAFSPIIECSRSPEGIPVTPPAQAPSNPGISHQSIADGIRHDHRPLIAELHIEPCEGGVAIRGRTASYFGKQIALYEVERRCRQNVVRQRISVA